MYSEVKVAADTQGQIRKVRKDIYILRFKKREKTNDLHKKAKYKYASINIVNNPGMGKYMLCNQAK